MNSAAVSRSDPLTRPTIGRAGRTDWGLLFVVLAMLIMGLVAVYSASYGFALIEGGSYEGNPTYFVKRQLFFALAGAIALFVGSRVDYRLYRRYALHILGATLFILLPLALGLGRWLTSGGSVQPSELAKLGAMIYIAVWLEAKGNQIRILNLGLVPFALLLGLIAGLIVLQPNFSTALLLVATAATMFFAAGADMKQMLIGFVFGGAAVALVAISADYRWARIDLWLRNPLSDVTGHGFQVIQALAALNRGGMVGVGLGQSQQKFAIFAPHTDGLFAIIGEEWGLLGTLTVVIVYALWAWRGYRIAMRAADVYGRLLAVGIVSWVLFQAALHIAVLTASTPFTGTVLPLMSYGGSSLLTAMAAVGVLLNISRHTEEKRGSG
jgi:cell division protein FtsW